MRENKITHGTRVNNTKKGWEVEDVYNKIIIRYMFTLSRMDDLMDILSGVRYFINIVLKSGYHYINLK